MAGARRSLTSNFTQHLSRRLIDPSFSHLLHDDREASPNPCPAPSPPPPPRNPETHARSLHGFGLFRPRDPRRSRVGFYTPLGVDPFLRSYSSAPEGSNEIDYIKDVAKVLSDTTVDAAAAAAPAASAPAPYAGEVAAAAADSFVPVAALQYLIHAVHSVTGLNWLACIALTTSLIRSATVPLLLNQLKATTKPNMTATAAPAPYSGEVAAAAADSFFPVAALQYLIDGVHSVTGLNCATVLLLLNQLKATTKLNRRRRLRTLARLPPQQPIPSSL